MLHKMGYEFTCEHCEELKREEDMSFETYCNDCTVLCDRCNGPEVTGNLYSGLCESCGYDMGVLK